MKKISIIVLLLVFMLPLCVKAENCDYKKHQQYIDFAKYIKLEKVFSNSRKVYRITLYNVSNGLYIKYNNREYEPNSSSSIVIDDVGQGVNSMVNIYGKDDGCDNLAVGSILISTPYYNNYYGSYECDGYEDKISYCSSEFTNIKVTETLLKQAILDYNLMIKNRDDKTTPDEPLTISDKIKKFVISWGIKFLLATVTTAVSIWFFNRKFIKIKHGI